MHYHNWGSHRVKCDSYCSTGFWDVADNGHTHTHTHTHTRNLNCTLKWWTQYMRIVATVQVWPCRLTSINHVDLICKMRLTFLQKKSVPKIIITLSNVRNTAFLLWQSPFLHWAKVMIIEKHSSQSKVFMYLLKKYKKKREHIPNWSIVCLSLRSGFF